jgi:fructose-1,6-bisphosphatase II / sedoheptulose-1,7-bisphosphatase
MDKLAVGPGYPEGIIDLAKSPTENVKAVAAAKGVEPARSSSACSTGRAMPS